MSREHLLNAGWRRHSIISDFANAKPTISRLLPNKIQRQLETPGAIIIIATYDCAVVSDNFTSEPWVQLMVAIPVSFEKNLAKSRNPRVLHFHLLEDNQSKAFEVNAAGICQVEREVLTKLDPDPHYLLPDTDKHSLINWISDRFKLVTWPDALNTALKGRNRQLKKLWKKYNAFISALYLQLDSYEEIHDRKYKVAAFLATESGQLRSLVRHLREQNASLIDKNAADTLKHLEIEISNAFGDAVEFMADPSQKTGKAIHVMDEEQITLSMLRKFDRFSPYSMSDWGAEHPTPIDLKEPRI